MSIDSIAQARERLPVFSAIQAAEIVPTLNELLEKNRADIAALCRQDGELSFASFVKPMEEIGDRLSRFFSPISHLHSVADNEALREAYNEAIPLLSQYGTELAQNDELCTIFKRLRESAEYATLNSAEARVIDNALRDFRLGGIDLEDDARTQFRKLSQELAQLTTRFEENVLDATQAWHKDITDAAELNGLPSNALALVEQNAKKENLPGYRLNLDFPCYLPVMTHCNNRDLRREMYEAYVTRASDQGPHAGKFDNSDVIERILDVRHQLAQLVGFPNYAEYSLATKMADSVATVVSFLNDLAARSRDAAEQDYADLKTFAEQKLGIDTLQPWDTAYCAEKLRLARFNFSPEELRPYFPTQRVIAGLFETVHRLFDVNISAVDGIDTWNSEVEVYQIHDTKGELRGLFYLDLYAREHKRGGAWMDECIVRRHLGSSVQTPVAYLTCNFTPPVDGKDALLSHDEVLTLFHEFGHGLHHMLTLVDRAAVSGINGVPWDGVELPSQFLENWCWTDDTLALVSAHVDSGEPVPSELVQRLHAARNFQAGMQMVRQLEFSLFDMRLHAEYCDGISVQGLLDEIRDQVAVVKPPPYNRFQHGFSHIFAGGYAAGYYSYKWAEVLSADAFSRFEQDGVFNRDTGREFRECILERGGAEDTMDLFKRFRGREPQIDALLRHAGLTA